MNRIGRIVTPDTIGNISRPPYRSVSPPTRMRPSEPTTTGTATSSDCWNGQVQGRCEERASGLTGPRPEVHREPERGHPKHQPGPAIHRDGWTRRGHVRLLRHSCCRRCLR